jgi:V/A-type H+-transporting ATPase subunit K
MGTNLLGEIGIGLSFMLSVVGASIGMVINGQAVIGALKRCYVQNRPAPFVLVVFSGTTLSNVIYGYLSMSALADSTTLSNYRLLFLGISVGLCVGIVAIVQAIIAAAAAEAYGETRKGFGNMLMVVGIAETVSLFAVVFTILFAS